MEEHNSKSLHEEQDEMSTSNSQHPSIKSLPIILAVIITAVVVGGGMYWWQSSQTSPITEDETEMVEETSAEPEAGSIISETQEGDYAVAIEQEPLGESVVVVRDTYNEGAGFSLHLPSSWGLVSVKKRNLTDSGGGNPPQRASYTFTSEFIGDHYFEVIISYANEKDSSIVTQQNRIYITEDDTYYYNYNPSTRFCVEEGKCKEDEVEEINAEIQEIIDSFELL